MFCREQVAELRRGREAHPIDVIFVHSASVDQGERFFSERWPEAAAIADPEHALYSAFGLGSGTAAQLFGPRVWLSGLRALRNGLGLPEGDPKLMSGAFWIRGGRVLAAHPSSHAGDVLSAEAASRLTELAP